MQHSGDILASSEMFGRWNMAYEKSLAGMQEITHPQQMLNARQRQVLILIDGKRSRDELEKYLNRLNVAEIVSDLERLGFIHDPEKSRTTRTVSHEKLESSGISSTQISTVKLLMLDSAEQHLGLMGKPLIDQIRRVENHDI